MKTLNTKNQTIYVFIVLFFCFYTSNAQRYLTNQFTQVDSTVNIIYGNANDYLGNSQPLKLDFYQPNGDVVLKRPLIIYIHGGGFTSGTRKYLHIKNIISRMVLKGYTAASIDYRLDPTFQLYNSTTNRRAMTDAMHDAKAAIRYFKANANTYGIDTNQIIIGGESAGAITSMMAAYVDKQSEMTVYPMANPNNPIGTSGNAGYSNKVKATLCLCGLILDTTAIEFQDKPMLVVHSTSDTFIPLVFAQNIVKRNLNTSTTFTNYFFNGATHCPWITTLPNYTQYEDSTVNLITNFLYSQIQTSIKSIINKTNGLKIYPNPSNGDVFIENETNNNIKFKVIDVLGEEIISNSIASSDIFKLRIDKLKAGIYIIQSIQNNIIQNQKLIVK